MKKNFFTVGRLALFTACLGSLFSHVNDAHSESQYASEERNSAAVAHYARARSLLVEAVREFESGRELARPDMFFDGDSWRTNIVSRAEDLNRVLDPKPRVTRSGVTFRANPALIKREKEVRPLGNSAPQTSSYSEEQTSRSFKSSETKAEQGVRARLDNAVTVPQEAPLGRERALIAEPSKHAPTEKIKESLNTDSEASTGSAPHYENPGVETSEAIVHDDQADTLTAKSLQEIPAEESAASSPAPMNEEHQGKSATDEIFEAQPTEREVAKPEPQHLKPEIGNLTEHYKKNEVPTVADQIEPNAPTSAASPDSAPKVDEDTAIANDIENAIKERLKKMSELRSKAKQEANGE